MSDPAQDAHESGWIVVTTVNPPSPSVRALAEVDGWDLVVVGDTKSPADWQLEGVHYLSLARQEELYGELARLIPHAHYSRKNLGYLYAVSHGAERILDTDDDNLPNDELTWDFSRTVRGRLVEADGWVNVYRYFTDALIWPRGLPLDQIPSTGTSRGEGEGLCAIQQFLADGDPDVDAIYRLVLGTECFFDRSSPVILERGAFCPFNSQNTLFYREAFPLLYLPSHVSFRMTDIWRSFVAQTALWEHDGRIAFQPASAVQERNPHDLMRDFADEVPGYTHNHRIARTLADAARSLSPEQRESVAATSDALWGSLGELGVIPAEEGPVLQAWLDALAGSLERASAGI